MGKKQAKKTEQSQRSDKTQPSKSGDVTSDSADEKVEVHVQTTDEQNGTEESVTGNGDLDLENEVHELTSKLSEANEKYVRMAAEHENYRRRMTGELDRARKFEVANFAREMLEVLESLDRACEIPVDDDALSALDSMREGVELTRKQLIDGLGKFSIEEISPQTGEAFDVNFHQAMTMEPTSEVPANHVVNTFRKGYKIHDRLLRPAMVMVACKPDTNDEAQDDAGEA